MLLAVSLLDLLMEGYYVKFKSTGKRRETICIELAKHDIRTNSWYRAQCILDPDSSYNTTIINALNILKEQLIIEINNKNK